VGCDGIGKYFPPRLTSARRLRIEEELRGWDLILPGSKPLLDDLAAAVGRYDRFRYIRETSRPAAVRGNLDAALKAATKLNQRLNALDGKSCLLINEAANVDLVSLHNDLNRIVEALFAASLIAKQYPTKGNLPKNERLFLAAEMRDVLNAHLGVNCSKALEGGCFEAILGVVLKEALRKATERRRGLARSLVYQVLSGSVKTEHPDGVVEYIRP
jgi:hypothetical protein